MVNTVDEFNLFAITNHQSFRSKESISRLAFVVQGADGFVNAWKPDQI